MISTLSEERKSLFVENIEDHLQSHVGVGSAHVAGLPVDRADQLVVQCIHVDRRQRGTVRSR